MCIRVTSNLKHLNRYFKGIGIVMHVFKSMAVGHALSLLRSHFRHTIDEIFNFAITTKCVSSNIYHYYLYTMVNIHSITL